MLRACGPPKQRTAPDTRARRVNRFTDQTQAEFQRLNGVTPHIHREMAQLDTSNFVPLSLGASEALPPSVCSRRRRIVHASLLV